MNDLKPEARSLLQAARGAESLGHQDRARIKRRVLMQVAVVGGSATVGGGAVAMSLTKITLLVTTVAALGGGAVSVWAWQRSRPTPVAATSRPTVKAAESELVPPETAPTVTMPRAEEAPAVRPEPVRHEAAKNTARRSPPAAAPTAEVADLRPVEPLDRELRVLRQAQDDLRAGLPAQALRRLQDFDRRFGAGSLGQERQAVAAIAQCQASPGPAAQARAQAFLRSTPESPLVARVRSACGLAPTSKQINEIEGSREP